MGGGGWWWWWLRASLVFSLDPSLTIVTSRIVRMVRIVIKLVLKVIRMVRILITMVILLVSIIIRVMLRLGFLDLKNVRHLFVASTVSEL